MSREHWDERYGTEELIWKADPNRFLVEELQALAPGRALDVACGEGRNAVWARLEGLALPFRTSGTVSRPPSFCTLGAEDFQPLEFG